MEVYNHRYRPPNSRIPLYKDPINVPLFSKAPHVEVQRSLMGVVGKVNTPTPQVAFGSLYL